MNYGGIAEYNHLKHISNNGNIYNIKIKDITINTPIILGDGSIGKMKAIFKTEYNGQLIDINGLHITPNHSIFINGKWTLPIYISDKKIDYNGYIYSFILDKITDKGIMIENIPCITYGHGNNNDPILNNSYFSNYSNFNTFSNICNVRYSIDNKTNMINGIERIFMYRSKL